MSYFGTIYADTELPSRARAVYLLLLAPAEGNVFSFKQYLSRRLNQKTAHELSQSAFTRSAFSYQSAK